MSDQWLGLTLEYRNCSALSASDVCYECVCMCVSAVRRMPSPIAYKIVLRLSINIMDSRLDYSCSIPQSSPALNRALSQETDRQSHTGCQCDANLNNKSSQT